MWLCKRDLSKECEGKYKNCTDCVLDQIRAEIDSAKMPKNQMSFFRDGIDYALQIIDKYRTGSEDEE